MKHKLVPSMMCCDFVNLAPQLRAFEACDIPYLHIDVMDGSFVPNFAIGTDFVKRVREATPIPMDIHLMVEYPERHLDAFGIREGDMVSVHYETTKHLQRVLAAVKARGAKVLLALNPATPVEMACEVLDDVDGLLIMTVNPGFAGQKMVPHAIEKIRRTRAFLDANGKQDAEIEVDGNVSIPNAKRMREAGANIFVGGSSAVFMGEDVAANIRSFYKEVF